MRLPLVLLAFLQPAAALVVSRAKLPRLACRGGAEGSEDAEYLVSESCLRLDKVGGSAGLDGSSDSR